MFMFIFMFIFIFTCIAIFQFSFVMAFLFAYIRFILHGGSAWTIGFSCVCACLCVCVCVCLCVLRRWRALYSQLFGLSDGFLCIFQCFFKDFPLLFCEFVSLPASQSSSSFAAVSASLFRRLSLLCVCGAWRDTVSGRCAAPGSHTGGSGPVGIDCHGPTHAHFNV